MGHLGLFTMPDEAEAAQGVEGQDTGTGKEPLRELTLGRSHPGADPPGHRESARGTTDDDLEILAARCRAKAEAARWAAERQRRIRERDEQPDEDQPADPAMRTWADKLTDAYYWSCTGDTSGTSDPSSLDDVGGCYEALSEAIGLLHDTERRQRGWEKSLPLLAEAQSAVRRALQRLGVQDEPDQLAAFESVRENAAQHRIFLKRFLRADDLAEPGSWPELLGRIEARLGAGAPSPRQQAQLAALRSLCVTSNTRRSDETWRAILSAVEQLIAVGMPPSSRHLRELLLPFLDELPEQDDLSPGCRLVVREIDRYLATRLGGSIRGTLREPTAEVRRVAELLSGRSAVLIGGIRRPLAQEELRTSLGLTDLAWVATKEHQPIRDFEAAIARPEVAVVLLAIRWSSHSFGDVKQFCDRHGKLLVRLPGGYNPAQVAVQILAQCGERLGDC
jgi:hypothetical protein